MAQSERPHVPTESQIRQIDTAPEPPAGNEQLIAEVERLRSEVGRLSRKLVEERADRAVQREVRTVLSSLFCSPTVDPDDRPAGRTLTDGRFVPSPVMARGTVLDPEPGAPRVEASPVVALNQTTVRKHDSTYEFAPGDVSATAFDDFFNAPDPHLEKIRRFLLE